MTEVKRNKRYRMKGVLVRLATAIILTCVSTMACKPEIILTVEHCEWDMEILGVRYRCVQETYIYDKKSGSWPSALFVRARIRTPLDLVTTAGAGEAEVEVRRGGEDFQELGVDHNQTQHHGNTYQFVSQTLPEAPDDAITHYEMRWRTYSLKVDHMDAPALIESTAVYGTFGSWYSSLSLLVDPQDTSTYCDTLTPETGFVDDIPTFTEWGLIIFGVVLLGFISWAFFKRRRAVSVSA